MGWFQGDLPFFLWAISSKMIATLECLQEMLPLLVSSLKGTTRFRIGKLNFCDVILTPLPYSPWSRTYPSFPVLFEYWIRTPWPMAEQSPADRATPPEKEPEEFGQEPPSSFRVKPIVFGTKIVSICMQNENGRVTSTMSLKAVKWKLNSDRFCAFVVYPL